jgi:hypothetical protein
MSLSCSCKKVTKEHAAEREPVLRTGSLRFSVNQGDGAELATLRHRRLFAPDSPAMLGSLMADPNVNGRSCTQ